MKIGTLKQIKWRDSKLYLTQCNKEDNFKVAEICSVGYLVKEDKNSITLAGDVLDDGDIRRAIIIPKENII
jgi:hypothetical protein